MNEKSRESGDKLVLETAIDECPCVIYIETMHETVKLC